MFMAEVEGRRRLSQSQLAVWKVGLNWFFTAAPSGGAPGGGERRPETGDRRPESGDLKAESGEHLSLDPALAKAEMLKAESWETAVPCARGKEPPLAATDLGGPVWERELIRVLRERHYEWRTEQAYRMWARRFAAWLSERRHGLDTAPGAQVEVGAPHLIRPAATFSPERRRNLPDGGGEGSLIEAAGELELRGFLSELAVRQRVAVATQRQALNALAFLMREALGKPLADFSEFERARPGKRLPVVLSREECQRLLGVLEATPRLMAELMYGSGVRLLELLRLRVKDVDRTGSSWWCARARGARTG
jgi:hypothetical protein